MFDIKSLFMNEAGDAGAAGGAGGAAAGSAGAAGAAAGTGGAAAGTGGAAAGTGGAAAGAGKKNLTDDDGGSSDGGTPSWPENWRALVDPDGKHAKTLDRLASPRAMFESYTALRQKLSTGELKPVTAYPEKGTPEEQNTWRKEHGIPEKPEDYKVQLREGYVPSEAEKASIDSFLKTAHAVNMSADVVNNVMQWYAANQDAQIAAQEERDNGYLQEAEDALRAEWGNEYRRNINSIKGLVGTMPEGLASLFTNARDGEGRALLNNPEMARWMVSLSKQVNPLATVVPGASNAAAAIESEIDEIEKLMRTDRKAYNRDEKKQARLRELYQARDRAKG